MKNKFAHSNIKARQTKTPIHKRPDRKKPQPAPASTTYETFNFIPQSNLRLTAWQCLFIGMVISSICLPEIQAAQRQIEVQTPTDPDETFALTNNTDSRPVQQPVQRQPTSLTNPTCFFSPAQPVGTTLIEPYPPVKTRPAKLYFHGIPVINMPEKTFSCLSGIFFSTPELQLEGRTWSLQKVDPTSTATLEEYYNRRLLKECLGVDAVQSRYVSRYCGLEGKQMVWFATEQVPGYVSAYDLTSASRGWFTSDKVSARRQLVEKIGEKGLVDILIAASFLGFMPGGGWGAVDGRLLVTHAARYAPRELGRTNFAISLDNINDMHARYQELRAKRPPQVHESVDMSEEHYQMSLEIFMNICKEVQAQGLMNDLDPQLPDFAVNELWTKAFNARWEDIFSSDERSTSCYVGL